MSDPFRVRVFKGAQLLHESRYVQTPLKIGRHANAHVRLDDRNVAAIHAVLAREGKDFVLTDLSGARGTFVGGERIFKKRIAEGEEIRIGEFRVLVDRAPVQALPESPAAQVPPPAPEPAEPVVATPAPAPSEEPIKPPEEKPAASVNPFGTYVPRAPEPPRRAVGAAPALQLAAFWGDQPLGISQHPKPEIVRIGPSSDGAMVFGERDQVLVEPLDGGFALRVESGTRAFRRREGKVEELSAGAHVLQTGDFAWLEIDGVRIEASFADPPPKAAAPLATTLDVQLINMLALLFLVAGVFVVMAGTRTDLDLVMDDFDKPSKLAVHFMQQIKPPPPPPAKALAPVEEKAPKAPMPEGQAGDPDLPKDKPRVGALGKIKFDTKELVPRAGLIASLGGPGVASLFNGPGFGEEVRAALGNLAGPARGPAGGLAGMGLRGAGPGGGGESQPISIGNIFSTGRSGGNASYGSGLGKFGGKSHADVAIDASEPESTGSLDPEMVRQVIRSHVAQIRYCYEQRLASDPDLEGKVRVRFTVQGDGSVANLSIIEGTTIADLWLRECISTRVRSWRFPSPRGGGTAIVTYPFWLKRSGSD